MGAAESSVGIERRQALRVGVGALAAALAAVFGVLAGARRRRGEARSWRLPAPARDGVSFYGDVVLVRDGERLTALSARCPHLGCRIGRLEGEVLVCPCHGSRFDLAGKRLAGPASADLTPADLVLGPGAAEVTVVLAR